MSKKYHKLKLFRQSCTSHCYKPLSNIAAYCSPHGEEVSTIVIEPEGLSDIYQPVQFFLLKQRIIKVKPNDNDINFVLFIVSSFKRLC